MFFQISPVIHKKPKPVEQKKPQQEEIEILSLAPFTENPKIVFENVAVGTTQKRNLIIKNPTTHDINLFIKPSIPSELNFSLNWHEATIEKGSEQLLEMVWTPTQKEGSRHTFVISDGKRINRNIGVTFKAIEIPKETGKGAKKIKTAVKLPLIRRPVSPIKKLRPSKYSPNRNNHSSLKCHNSPSPHRKYIKREVENNSQRQYQNGNMKMHKENKENTSPGGQEGVHYKNGSFLSPNNNPFFMDINTYKFNSEFCERRDTYVVGQENIPNNSIFEMSHTLVEKTESFYLQSKENSPYFRDSLDSPKINLLRERNDIQGHTPTLESLVRTKRRLAAGNFEDRLKVNAFAFSPRTALTPQGEQTFKFAPEVYSTRTKPPSNDNSLENPKIMMSLDFSKANMISPSARCDLNKSNETYTKGNASVGDSSLETYLRANLSGGTYVKGNISGETYTKGNVSGETYVKDSSVGNLAQLDVSPVSTRAFLVPSPVQRMFDTSPINEHSRIGHKLSIIAEESMDERPSRSTAKRRNTIVNEYPPKREKLSPNWSKCNKSSFRLSTSSTGLNLNKYLGTSVKGEPQPLVSISETTTKTVIVKNPFLYANIIDPFMTSQIYSNEDWIEQQMNNFKKWLNALLTPPDELNTKTEIDVAKVWQECTKKEVSDAPTKEALSLKCHTNKKLDYVRKQAQQLFRSAEMSAVLQKVCLVIETGKLSIRDDKDLHLNLKLKSDLTRLILGYNPLWLRIGLETIYNEVIPMRSNSDTHALATFILERLLKDPHLTKRHKTVYAPKYSTDLKKFILKKFLILVYFLDRAKSEKLIQHDPCLFCKNAVEKESKLVLTHFARETLSAMGDITKYLKCMGYVVTHVQQYIHEFDYAVKNLGTDLRDGVRLTRVMEIIQMRNDLTMKLRVPAISRLQKVHNMNLVFKSLQDYGYEIQYDIVPKDIVDGHREKNLSFLWQIIYKFEAPLMVKSARTIQTWFRSLPVQIKMNRLRRAREKRENAAKRIQLWYRRQKLAEKYFALGEFVDSYIEQRKRHLAAVKIQSFFRMKVCRRRFVTQYRAVIMLQTYAKGWLIRNYHRQRITACVVIQKVFRGFVCRKRYLTLKKNVICMQQRFRANKMMKIEKMRYDSLKQHTIIVQRKFRALKQTKLCRQQYVVMKEAAIKIQSFCRMYVARKQFTRLKESTILIQRRYRAQMQMKSAHLSYLSLKHATRFIQQRFRANKEMNICRNQFILIKSAAIKIQSFYRMYQSRNRFVKLKTATIIIQARFRALILMKCDKNYYLSLRNATVNIQRRFRANIEMKKVRTVFMFLKKAAIKLQSFYRMYTARKKYQNLLKATKVIQQRYRAQKAMQVQRCYYNKLLTSVTRVQRRFRANIEMKRVRQVFLDQREAAIQIQSHCRMVTARKNYLNILKAAKVIQQRYRAQKAMQLQHCYYNKLLTSIIFLQRRYRANVEMERVQKEFMRQRHAAIKIQSFYKMYIARKEYLNILKAAKVIQQWYRAQKAMQLQHCYYNELLTSVIFVQRRYRANVEMERVQKVFMRQRHAAIKIQSFYRMHTARKEYLNILKAAKVIQQRYRAQKAMQLQHCYYNRLLTSIIFVQRRYRANVEMERVQKVFINQRHAAIKIQSFYRMYTARKEYINILKAAKVIQQRYRAQKAMQLQHCYYNELLTSVIFVQRRYRANVEMERVQKVFMRQRHATIKIQSFYRMYTARKEYLNILKAAKVIQQRYRAQKAMQEQHCYYTKLLTSVLYVQHRFRANCLKKQCRKDYLSLRHSSIVIQAQFKMLIRRREFLKQKKAAITIQRWCRASVAMKKERDYYNSLKLAVRTIESRYQARKLMQVKQFEYSRLKQATIVIQTRYRSLIETRKAQYEYLTIKYATVTIQTRYRAILLARREKHNYNQLKNATVCIQQRFRAICAMRMCRAEFEAKKSAVILVQRKYRAQKKMVECRSKYVLLQQSCIFVQRKYRAQKYMLQCQSEYRSLKQATILTQQRFRANILARQMRLQYQAMRNATLTIQRTYKAKISMQVQRQQFLIVRSSIVIIQQRYRAAVLMRQSKSAYLALKQSTVLIQRKYRALVAMKHAKENFEKLKTATIFIQRRYRANVVSRSCRQSFLALRQAAITIQRRFRSRVLGLKQITEYSRLKWAAIVLQRRYRAEKAMQKEMSKYITLRSATFIIQRRWRATLLATTDRKMFLLFKLSIIKIQRFYKSYLFAKTQREWFLRVRNAVVQIQRFGRGYLVRQKYASLLTPEAIEARRIHKLQSAAAVKIQAVFRGHRLRKSKIPQVVALRTRRENQLVNHKSTSDGVTLAERYDAAMTCIVAESSSLLMVNNALEDLDFISRHSQNLCIRLSHILPAQLYLIITSAARSLPEMNALNTATLVLINFCKYPKTREYSWDAEYMDGLINVMLHWCDKEAPLFCTLCTLVWLFGHNEKWKKVLVSLPNIQQRFAKIHSLVNRKQNMVMKSKKLNHTSPFGPTNGLKQPTKTANWGLDYDRPNTFTNAVFALTNVMKVLEL